MASWRFRELHSRKRSSSQVTFLCFFESLYLRFFASDPSGRDRHAIFWQRVLKKDWNVILMLHAGPLLYWKSWTSSIDRTWSLNSLCIAAFVYTLRARLPTFCVALVPPWYVPSPFWSEIISYHLSFLFCTWTLLTTNRCLCRLLSSLIAYIYPVRRWLSHICYSWEFTLNDDWIYHQDRWDQPAEFICVCVCALLTVILLLQP